MVRRIRGIASDHPYAFAGTGIVVLLLIGVVLAVAAFSPSSSNEQAAYVADQLDTSAPAVDRVVPTSPTEFRIYFSEPLDPTTVIKQNFATKPKLNIARVRLSRDGSVVTISLRGTKQRPGAAYMVGCAPGAIRDLAKNVNQVTIGGRFPGFGGDGGVLVVRRGTGQSRPRNQVVRHPGDMAVVEQLQFTARRGDVTIASLGVRATSTNDDLFADLTEALLFEDNGDGVFQSNGSDKQIGGARPFSGRAPGSPALFTGIGYTIQSEQTKNIWVLYRLGNLAGEGHALGATLRPSDIVLSAGRLKRFDELLSANDGKTLRISKSSPSLSAGRIVDPTTVEARFDTPVEPRTVSSNDFRVNGKKADDAELLSDGVTVRLGTDSPVDSPVEVTYGEPETGGGLLALSGAAAGYGSSVTFTMAQSVPDGDTTPPNVPNLQSAVVGADPVIATVTWQEALDNIAVTGYRVWRAASDGVYRSIGTTTATSYADMSGVPGQGYRYKVSAYDAASNESTLSAASVTVTATWTIRPHKTYGTGNTCSVCHVSHRSATKGGLLRDVGGTAGEVTICYECHDTAPAGNIKSGATNSFLASLASGHVLESKVDTTNVDLTNACSGCHGPHRDSAANDHLYRRTINGNTVTGENKSWCLACHDSKHSWWKPGEAAYDALLAAPQRIGSYPATGTYPGGDIASGTANPHASVAETPGAEPGACRMCHEVGHRSAAPYDMLRYRISASAVASVTTDRQTGAYAEACLRCHYSGNSWSAPDIKSLVTYAPTDDTANAGHRVKTAGGLLPPGAPLPCHECHNAHGSSRGNATSFSDALGRNLTTGTNPGVRAFCLTCHSSDEGRVWDSVGGVYRASTAADLYLGLRRDGTGGNMLRLVPLEGHGYQDAQPCYQCHGNDSTPGKGNPHNPGPGESSGLLTCTQCHDEVAAMQTTTSYHHAISNDTTQYATLADPTQLTATDSRRNCLTCHVDHDYFNKSLNVSNTQGRSRNLRSSISVTPVKTNMTTYLSTDADPATGNGVCISCHRVRITKNTTARKTDKTTSTVPVSSAGYVTSGHNYSSFASTFTNDASAFTPNCAKCHNDRLAKQYQQAGRQFGLHDSTTTALQVDGDQGPLAEDPQQQLCYLCHSRAIDASPRNPNGGSSYADSATRPDMYGSTSKQLLAASLSVKASFSSASIVSSHPVEGLGVGTSARVECANCHNPHKTSDRANDAAQDPDNTLLSLSDGSATAYYSAWYNEASLANAVRTNRDFCLRCHDGAAPVATNAAAYVPYSVHLKPNQSTYTNPSKRTDNKAVNVGKGHSNTSVAGQAAATALAIDLACADCHDRHGSTLPALLGTPARASQQDVLGTRYIYKNTTTPRTVTGNDNTVCAACHDQATGTYPIATTTAQGYPMRGRFPGTTGWATYNASTHTGNPHRAVEWPRSGGSGYAAGDCKQCHDPHGTANQFDQLRTEGTTGVEAQYLYNTSNFGFCFNCHDPSGPAASDIASSYPAGSGGTGSQANAGHRTTTSGHLPSDSALPCYYCHGSHGSPSAYSLLVVTQSQGATIAVGDAAGELNMSPGRAASDVRKFCFTCHATADATAMGWNGAAYQAVGNTSRVAGILRTSTGARLVLTTLFGDNAHNQAGTTSCYSCHSSSHAPATPEPATRDCYSAGCHDNLKNMEQGDVNAPNSYHHVLGTASLAGDQPGGTGSYPTSKQDVQCISCHTDHDYFDPTLGGSDRGRNLRSSINSTTGSQRENVDFVAAQPDKGLCVSCHSVRLDKDTTNQKKDNTVWETQYTTQTPVIGGGAFTTSAHQYAVSGTVPNDSSAVQGNCAKCHNDNAASAYGISPAFQVHYSSERNILSALGVSLTDPLAGKHCFGCHSENNDIVGGKTVADRDAYGAAGAVMGQSAELVYKAFKAVGGSAHPVEGSPSGKVLCENCHNPHVVSQTATQTDPANSYLPASYSSDTDKRDYCLKCHTTAGLLPNLKLDATTYVAGTVQMTQPKMDKVANQSRSHWNTASNGSFLPGKEVVCQDCHDKHGSKFPKIVGVYDPGTNTARVNGQLINGNDNSVCSMAGCHQAAGLGTPPATPTTITINAQEALRDATGYFSPTPSGSVTTVRWPGMTVWGSVALANGKSLSPHFNNAYNYDGKPANDCKQCHDVHGSQYTYDETPKQFDSDNFTLCFDCHNGTGIVGLTDVARYYPVSVGGKGNSSDYAGHIIKTDDPAANLRKDDPLPCYDCHGQHGSANGNNYLISDQRWSGMIDSKLTQSREFCLGCHVTADGFDGEHRQLSPSNTDNLFEGFPRWPITPGRPANGLKIPALPAPNMEHHDAGTAPCTDCHGRDYSTATSINVHNPSPGVSQGGTACYNCHYAYTGMEDNIAPKTGDSNSYHHVLGGDFGGYKDGDLAPKDGAYPTSANEVFCVSCHVDHNYFNGPVNNPAANLRVSIGSTATASTDYVGSAPYGICISCHGDPNPLTKQTGQKADTVASTASPRIDGANYASSAHRYTASSWYDSPVNTFSADCVKCHDDNIDVIQDSPYAFGAHISPEQRILAALGATPEQALEEKHCYRCHAVQGDLVAGKTDPTKDWYGTKDMSTLAQSVFRAFQLTGSVHPVAGTGTGSSSRVECVNCHNAHLVSTTATVSVPSNTYQSANSGGTDWSTVDGKTAVCLQCHDGGTPVRVVTNATYVPYDVKMLSSEAPLMNKSAAGPASRSHWSTTGAIQAGERKTCVACHDKHGSNADKLLGVYNIGNGNSELGTQTITANDNVVCKGCHNVRPASYATPSRLASGYPNEGTWPGFDSYTAYSATTRTGAGHTTAQWPGKTYAAGDCKNCHDVHGTQNTYDMLRTENQSGVEGTYLFTQSNFTLCFNCHAAGQQGADIKQFYPSNVGGSGSITGRTGHQLTHASTTLPKGAALPCYECHNPHGSSASFALVVDTGLSGAQKILGDQPGELDMDPTKPAATRDLNNRRFCLSCHVTSDGFGWNGSGMLAVPSTAYTAGFQRIAVANDLSLSATAADHANGSIVSCDSCHADGGTGNNVHNPKTGGADHTADMLGDPDGAGPKPTYAQGTNYGCFGCHYPLLDVEHSTRNMDSTGQPGSCVTCHSHDGQNDSVGRAIAADDLRCVSCHNGAGDGIRLAHRSGGETAGSIGYVAEFADGISRSGHNSLHTNFGKTSYVTNGTTVPWPFPSAGAVLAGGRTRTSMVRCDECHFTTNAAGPQGAAVPYLLNDGTSKLYMTGQSPYILTGTTAPGLCGRCHTTLSSKTHGQGAHNTVGRNGTRPQDTPIACIDCHIAIPHGWKRPRLLRRSVGTTPDTAPYVYNTTGDNLTTGSFRLVAIEDGKEATSQSCVTSCNKHVAPGAVTYWP